MMKTMNVRFTTTTAKRLLKQPSKSGASAREATLVRKIGNPSSRENVVMTSPYERPSVQTRTGGGASQSIYIT